jgi:hypothetical protein
MDIPMSESITGEMEQIRLMIAQTFARRTALKSEMQEWYERFPGERFGKLKDLIILDSVLSELDTHYKYLWDFHNGKHEI